VGVEAEISLIADEIHPPLSTELTQQFPPQQFLLGHFTARREASAGQPDAHPLGSGADRPADVLAPETIRAMHLSRMRPAPEFARAQLAAGIGAERTGEYRERLDREAS
jgi:hypothetical protein